MTLLCPGTDNDRTVKPPTSCVTAVVALAVLLSTLAYAPFSHVHSEEGHHGAGEVHGFQVHSHLPEAPDEGNTHESVIDVSSDDGRHVDLFLSLASKPFSAAESVESYTDVRPQFETKQRQGTSRPDRARDPPAANLSSRPPPV